MSNIIFFLKIGPKTKVYAERRYGAFFFQKFVSTDKKWCIFTKNYFLGVEISAGPPNLPSIWENPKCD